MQITHGASLIETLEPRVAPAGIISVSVSAGTLVLTSISGETGDESLALVQTAPGELSIIPSNGTQLKLGSVLLPANQTQAIEGLFGSIKVSLGEGNDTLSLRNLQIAKTLSVDLGNGTNGITFRENGSYGAVTIKGGSGADFISVLEDHLTVAGSFIAKLAAGANEVECGAATSLRVGKDLSITTGPDNDRIALATARTVIGGKLLFATGPGADSSELIANNEISIAGEARMISLGSPTPGTAVAQAIRGLNLSLGPVTFAIGKNSSSDQEIAAFGDSLLVHGSMTINTKGDADGTAALEVRGGNADSSALLGNLTLKGHSDLLVSHLGLVTGNVTVTSGPILQLISLQGGVSVDVAFRVGGKTTIDTTKAATTIGQSTIAFGRFVPEGPLVVRDGGASVIVQFVDSRLLGSVTISTGAGNDTVKLDPNNFPEATIFFAPVLIKGEAGADTFDLGGDNPGDILYFRTKITVDGGLGTDVLNLGSNVTFSPTFPLVQIGIP